MNSPSRELDALVAEKVMGWKSVYRDDLKRSGWFDHGGYWYGSEPNPLEPALPPYTTDISAAWEVFQKISEGKSKFTLNCLWRDPEDGRWVFGEPDRDSGVWSNIGKTDTAPHAICLAALKAVGAL